MIEKFKTFVMTVLVTLVTVALLALPWIFGFREGVTLAYAWLLGIFFGVPLTLLWIGVMYLWEMLGNE